MSPEPASTFCSTQASSPPSAGRYATRYAAPSPGTALHCKVAPSFFTSVAARFAGTAGASRTHAASLATVRSSPLHADVTAQRYSSVVKPSGAGAAYEAPVASGMLSQNQVPSCSPSLCDHTCFCHAYDSSSPSPTAFVTAVSSTAAPGSVSVVSDGTTATRASALPGCVTNAGPSTAAEERLLPPRAVTRHSYADAAASSETDNVVALPAS